MVAKEIFEIDNSVREKMSLLDPRMHNFFENDFTLIMDFTPYRDKIVFGKPMRTPEHRLIYVSEGNANFQIGFDEFELNKGCLILVPRGTVIITEDISRNYSPYTLAFNFPEADGQVLMPYSATSLRLSPDEQLIVTNYFLLIDQLVKKYSADRRGVDFLIVSLLYHIYTLREKSSQTLGAQRSTRGMIIRDRFLFLINSPQIPMRTVGWYADQLGITEEYLRSTIKAQTMQTPMQWINMATVREARLLLVDAKHYSLSHIAEQLHFSDDSQFIKFYKRETGETPNDFRKRMK